jgi:hypothetical protein
MKSSKGTLGGVDFYEGRVAVIKESSFRAFSAVRDSSERFVRQTLFRSSMCELL